MARWCSGAASAQQDEELALAGAAPAKDFEKTSVTSAPINFFDKDQVKAAFAKGAILLDGNDNRNYMIHASRRETPGMAESTPGTPTLFMCWVARRHS